MCGQGSRTPSVLSLMPSRFFRWLIITSPLPPVSMPTLSTDHPTLHSITLLAAAAMTTATLLLLQLLLLLALPLLQSPTSPAHARNPCAAWKQRHECSTLLVCHASMQTWLFVLFHLLRNKVASAPPDHRLLPTRVKAERKTKQKAKKPKNSPVYCMP